MCGEKCFARPLSPGTAEFSRTADWEGVYVWFDLLTGFHTIVTVLLVFVQLEMIL